MVVGRITLKFFVNRKKELQELEKNTEALLKGEFKNYIVVNPRRMGKTTLIHKHIQKVNSDKRFDRVIPVYINCQTTTDWEDLTDRLLDITFESYNNKIKDRLLRARFSEWVKESLKDIFERIGFIEGEIGTRAGEYFKTRVSIQRERKGRGDILRLIDRALWTIEELASKKGVYFEVFLDEFQQIRKFEAYLEVLATMREAFQHQKRTTYLLSGSSVTFMQEIYTKESSAFFKQLATIQLSFLSEKNIEDYVRLRDRKYTEEGVRRLLDLTNGIPDYVAKIVDEADIVDRKNVEKVFDSIIKREAKTFAEIYDSLTINQQKIIIAIAKGKRRYKEIAEVLKGGKAGAILMNMVTNGQLYQPRRGEYKIFDVGLKRYVQLMIKEGYLF